MRKLKICVLSLIVTLVACEVGHAGSFSFGGSKKKKEESKQQVARQTQKPAVKQAESADKERKQPDLSDLNKAGTELPAGQTGGGGGSTEPSAANGYRSNVPVNPNSQIVQNPNMSFVRNPNSDIPRVTSAAVSAPGNPNANAIPRNPSVRES